jgi:NADH-quinone oxidoreductase subunit N
MTLAHVLAQPEPATLGDDLLAHAPLALVVLVALVLLLTDAFARTRAAGFQRHLALLGLGVALVPALRMIGASELDLGRFAAGELLVLDHLTALGDVLVIAATAGVVALAREQGPPARAREGFGEREPLLVLACAGALLCVHAGDLVTIWLGVELLGMAALALLLASHDATSSEAKRALLLRTLVPALLGTSLLALGIALVYAALGTTSLDGFGRAVTRVFAQWGGVQRWVILLERHGAEVAATDPAMHRQAHAEIVRGMAPAALVLPGLLILLVALLAKLGLWPFVRRRELDEDGPLHVAALRSTVVVVALACVLVRVFVGALHMPRLVNEPYGWTGALPSLALVAGTVAVVSAVRQRRLPRIVAGLAGLQLSLLLLALVVAAGFHGHVGAGGRAISPNHEIVWSRLVADETLAAMLAMLVADTLALLGCHAAIAAARGERGPEVRMQHWAGMAARRPALALALALCLASLVGLPPLAGFVGKLGLLRALAEHSALRWMIVPVVLQLALAAFVVLRVIVAMVFGDEQVSEPGERPQAGAWPGAVAVLAGVLVVVLGLAGQRLLELVRLPAATSSYTPGDDQRVEWLDERRAAWALEDARFETADVEADETGETGDDAGDETAGDETAGMSLEPP